jgi:hypothetical protein
MVKSESGTLATLGSSARARVRLVVWVLGIAWGRSPIPPTPPGEETVSLTND